ncbi:MAG TPA: hypothetical protein VMT44_06405 [Methanoregula sp.]|nr:hypothetical protein [Methanoregula sp.]
MNVLVAEPAEFDNVRVHEPGVTPMRLKLRIISVEVSVDAVAAPVIGDEPVCESVTVVAPLPVSPVPVISIVCQAPLDALVGEIVVITGEPAVPVAVKVTAVIPVTVAVRVFDPAVVPSVHPATEATPFDPVVVDPPDTLPPPEAMAKITVTPLTGLLFASFTITLGGVATAVPTAADCPSPAFFIICVAGPAVPVAVKVTGDPVKEPLVAVSVLVPAVVPNVQLPTVAIPLESVVAEAPVREPPPEPTANVTVTPLTGLLLPSLTITLGGVATAVPATVD